MITLSIEEKEQFGNILKQIAGAVDLTEAQYKIAIERYKAVGEFLSSPNSLLYFFKPTIKPQGSFRTGTPVRPLRETDEFDVDLTCVWQASLPNNQSELKELVGRQLASDATYKKMLVERQRCWRLKYAESSRFHLDIVPAIPDDYNWLLWQGVPREYAKHAINITDNERPNYNTTTVEFPKSNTEGYALWFLDIMKIEATQIRMKLKAELRLGSIEEVPDYKVRTPLQIAVQLMKQHRNIMFDGKSDPPISIIISTLSAKAYQYVMKNRPAPLFYDLLLQIVDSMLLFIENRNGVMWVPNPVNPKENFADKWFRNPAKESNFRNWHKEFRDSLTNGQIKNGFSSLSGHLKDTYGSRFVNEALDQIGSTAKINRDNGLLRTTSAGIIGTSGIVIKPHTFHGGNKK